MVWSLASFIYRMQIARHEPNSILLGITRLAEALSGLETLEKGLSQHDRERAGRYHFREDRARLALGRRVLAALLRGQPGLEAPPLELKLTDKGQPYLPDRPDVAFSISHAGDLVVVALTVGARVGVDVESLNRRVEFEAIAERIFNAADLARFRTVPEAEKERAFFRAWTGKEAVLKARGVGLSGGLADISVPLNDSAETIRAEDGEIWRIQPLTVADGHVGTVACDDPSRALRARHFTLAELTSG
jgi:4'-phosphopantetheinyl transferase